jgi:hypothetical protein
MFPFQLGMTAVGIGASIYGARQKSKASKELAASSAREEAARREAAKLQFERQQREYIRQGYLTEAESTSRMFAGAGLSAGNSAVGGTRGQEANQTAGNLNYNMYQYQLGEKIFNEKANQARIKQKQAEGGGIEAIGKMFMSSAGPAAQIAGSIFGSDGNTFQPGGGSIGVSSLDEYSPFSGGAE